MRSEVGHERRQEVEPEGGEERKEGAFRGDSLGDVSEMLKKGEGGMRLT